MGMAEQQLKEIAVCEMRTLGYTGGFDEGFQLIKRFLAALPKPEPVGHFIPDSIERPVAWNQVKRGQGLPLYREPSIALPASEQKPVEHWKTPTTCLRRIGDAIELLCSGNRPSDEIISAWLDTSLDDFRLQEFTCEHGPSWSQGIAVIDAAMVLADQPTEGVDHELSPQPDYKAQRDAKRYRWLRKQHWNESNMCVVLHPKNAVRLGHECPSDDRLDAYIDAAIASVKGGA